MATVARTVAATPEEVAAVLADGWSYSNWVVGASHIRAVDADWPAAGSRLHHASGNWPLTLQDQTRVESVEPGRSLVLVAHGWPLGTARISLVLSPSAAGTTVTMTETPESGPGRWLHTPVGDALLAARNAESLARLAATVERRTSP